MATAFSAISAFTAANASTISALGVGASAVGTGYTALSGYQAAKAQQDAAQVNARIARENAALQESQIRRDNQRRIASSAATLGASGVQLAGTPLMVLADLVTQAEEEALLSRYGGEVNAVNASRRASAYGAEATSSLLGGGIGVGASLLSGSARHTASFSTPSVSVSTPSVGGFFKV